MTALDLIDAVDAASHDALGWTTFDGWEDIAARLGAAHEERGLDVERFVREVVAYYKLYDHQEVWNERGARALGKWLVARLATPEAAPISDQ